MGAFCCHGNQTKGQTAKFLAVVLIVLCQATFVPNKSPTASVVFEELSFKNSFLVLPWQPNKMATGHQTHKLGRQSSYDHKCEIWFTSLQWLKGKCN